MDKGHLKVDKVGIIDQFDSLRFHVLMYSDVREMLLESHSTWGLPKRPSLGRFLEFMLAETPLKKVTLKFPSRHETRYIWRDQSVYAVASSLRPSAYFSHYTAMSIHDLTDQIPRTVYLNDEQGPKPRSAAGLVQSRIDAAFGRRPRVSRNIAQYEDYRLCLLNGKSTGRLGVVDVTGTDGEPLSVASIERTLIDIVVRPFYAGGVFQVLNAYRRARDRVDVGLLVKMLRQLDYVYPYHQAIGCYMEKAGTYTPDEMRMLRQDELKYDFYLTFQMSKPVYVEYWRLYVPKGF